MGNKCVASGGSPHLMTMKIINMSASSLSLSSKLCECDERHRGFSATHGKFLREPCSVIESSCETTVHVSGREGSAVCPAGWISYDIMGGGNLQISYNSAGWSDLQDRKYVRADVTNCSSLTVSVVESCEGRFEITVKVRNPGSSSHQSSSAGLAAANRVLPAIENFIPGGGLVTAGYYVIQNDTQEANRAATQGLVGGLVGLVNPVAGILAQNTGGRALANSDLNIQGPEGMAGSIKITELHTVPHFPTYKHETNLRDALDISEGGKVITGGPCAGVAIQRTWYLKVGYVSETSCWQKPRAPCIASDFSDWLRKDGFQTEFTDSWPSIVRALAMGHVVNCIIRNLHWVTIVGVDEGLVYAINYPGLFAVPETEFSKHVENVRVFAPSAAVAATCVMEDSDTDDDCLIDYDFSA